MSTKDAFISHARRQQLLNQQRKRLQQLRLQTESQNTKLLKIQQKQRQVEAQYQNQKKNMEQTLSKLAIQRQKFTNKQIITTKQFQDQKQQIFANDRKKQSYLKQKQDLQIRNKKRKLQIKQKQQTLNIKKNQLQQIKTNIKKYLIYQQFLKQVRSLSDDFSGVQVDQSGVMNILDRYMTMEKKKIQLTDLHKKIQQEKQMKIKSIQKLKKDKQQKTLSYNSKIKDFKEKIDLLNQENLHLESELEGRLNENGERQREIGQIIFSIRGLYQSIIGEQKQFRSTIEMLNAIKQERKKLKEYLELYQSKTDEKKKI